MRFIPILQATQLKQLGFNKPCWSWYNIPDEDIRDCYSEGRSPIINSLEDWTAKFENKEVENIGLPTFDQTFDFFREKHNYYISLNRTHDQKWFMDIYLIGVNKPKATVFGDTYEEVELNSLDKIIEMLDSSQELTAE